MADRLIELVPADDRFRRVLDIGSATGRVAMELSKRNPGAKVYGIDISEAMLLRARKKSLASKAQGPEFIVSDFEALPFKDGSIDLALSNLSYQWAFSLPDAFNELFRVIAPGGLVIINTLVHGTLGELKESFAEAEVLSNRHDKRPFMDFVKPGALRGAIESSGFEIDSFDVHSFKREYASVRELIRRLKYIGAVNPLPPRQGSTMTLSILKVAEDYYRKYFSLDNSDAGSKGVSATYNTVFIRARKAV